MAGLTGDDRAGRGSQVDGARLAELRRNRGLTQRALAAQAGLSVVIVRKLEQNLRQSARISTLTALAQVLGVPVGSLLVGQPGGQDRSLVLHEEDDAPERGPDRPTLLWTLIAERHLQRFRTFRLQFQRAAQEVAEREGDPGVAKLTISLRQWQRWYSGEVKTEPFPDTCRVLEHMFGYPVNQLLAPPESCHDDQGAGSDGFPEAALSIHGPMLPGHKDTEDVVDVLSRIQRLHRRTIHPAVISQLQDDSRQTISQYERLDHSDLAADLLKKRFFAESLLNECGRPAQQQQLCEIAGMTSGVLGYVAVGRGDFRIARAYTLEAFQLADFAGDADLQAWARGLQSFCEYYAGRYGEAADLARDGLRYAQTGPQSIRLTINGLARAEGKLGDSEGVHRAVGEAYELMSLNDVPGGVPSSISLECYSEAQTASNAATAYVSLGAADKVEHYVGLALPDISRSDSPWSRSLVMIDLALSLIRSDTGADLERASQLVLDAIEISAGRPIISVQQRISEFVRDAVGRWGVAPQVRAVLDAAPVLPDRA